MPLLDHFHPPLSDTQFWESFHSLWIAAMVERLNGTILPQGYLAQAGAYRRLVRGGRRHVRDCLFWSERGRGGRRGRPDLGAARDDAGFPRRLSR